MTNYRPHGCSLSKVETGRLRTVGLNLVLCYNKYMDLALMIFMIAMGVVFFLSVCWIVFFSIRCKFYTAKAEAKVIGRKTRKKLGSEERTASSDVYLELFEADKLQIEYTVDGQKYLCSTKTYVRRSHIPPGFSVYYKPGFPQKCCLRFEDESRRRKAYGPLGVATIGLIAFLMYFLS